MRYCTNTVELTGHFMIQFCFTGKSKEAEIKRINKELANVRNKFKGK